MIAPLISDTTLRDGLQGGLIFDAEDCLTYYDLISQVNKVGPYIHAAEVFCFHSGQRSIVERMNEKYASGSSSIRPVVWQGFATAMTYMPSYLPAGTAVGLGIPQSIALRHKEEFSKLESILDHLLKNNSRIQFHFEEIGQFDMGAIISFLDNISRIIPKNDINIQLSDTYGVCVPYATSELCSVPDIINYFEEHHYSKDQLTFHFHNDRGLAVANSLAALQAGCARIDGAFCGAGERGGLTPIEILLFAAVQNKPELEKELRGIGENIAVFLDKCGLRASPQAPFWGTTTNSMSAGKLAAMVNRGLSLKPGYAPLATIDTGMPGVSFLLKEGLGVNLSPEDPLVGEMWGALEVELLQTRRSLTIQEFRTFATSFITDRNLVIVDVVGSPYRRLQSVNSASPSMT